MNFESSKYFNEFENKKLVFSFGIFFLCNHFIISELNEGVHFDWEKIKLVMSKIIEFYGNDVKLGYISNRIHSYSIDPQTWGKVDEKYNIIIGSTIIYYNNMTYKNASLEKLFSNKSLKRSINLDEAIYWIKNLKEFN